MQFPLFESIYSYSYFLFRSYFFIYSIKNFMLLRSDEIPVCSFGRFRFKPQILTLILTLTVDWLVISYQRVSIQAYYQVAVLKSEPPYYKPVCFNLTLHEPGALSSCIWAHVKLKTVQHHTELNSEFKLCGCITILIMNTLNECLQSSKSPPTQPTCNHFSKTSLNFAILVWFQTKQPSNLKKQKLIWVY